ncbi:hypothetical protein Tco_0528121 [Tanacetum coccineum]
MYPPNHLSQPQINHSSVLPSQQYQSHMNHQTSSVPLIAYNSPQYSTQPMTEFPQMDSGLVVPMFNQGDDPIACLNKAKDFLTTIDSSRLPSTNNQLRTLMCRLSEIRLDTPYGDKWIRRIGVNFLGVRDKIKSIKIITINHIKCVSLTDEQLCIRRIGCSGYAGSGIDHYAFLVLSWR